MIRDKDNVRILVNRIKQSVADIKDGEQNEFTEGMIEAYTDVIDILRDLAVGEDLADLGLNFDPDKAFN